jgi:hypothetical protein
VTTFLEVFGARHDLLKERDRARQELGYDDLATEALAVEEREFLLRILEAHRDELRAQWRLPRGEIKAALHEAIAAVERDDLEGLSAAVLRVADVLGGQR